MQTTLGAIMLSILKYVAAAVACIGLLGACDTKPEPTKPKVLETQALR